MVRYVNECCDCASASYPCIGTSCPKINVKYMYCDHCKEEVDELYESDGLQLCAECLLSTFEKITLEDE